MDSENKGNAPGDRESSPSRQGKRVYQCRTVEQIQRLESYFKECSNPDDNQREALSRELGLDPDQIKFWFQKQRTQKKTQHKTEDNCTLRSEHERLLSQNLALREATKGVTCSTCSYVGPGNESKAMMMQELRIENAQMKEQLKNKPNLLPHHQGPSGPRAASTEPEETPQQAMSRTFRDLDRDKVLEIAASAMNELVGLLSTTEPVWVASSDGRCVLHRDAYERIRPMTPSSSPLRPTNARIESSKDSAEVAISAAELARLLSDPNQRMDVFPTIVSRAKTIRALDAQNLGGSMRLMYEKIHVLSPHVAAREFILIRHCRQLSSTSWAVADVSFNLFERVPKAAPVRSWKFPSGCVIQDTSDGKSNVTWVEHVHVDEDESQNHPLYRDLVRSGRANGAERWIAALRTACDRSASSNGPMIPPLRHELERGRKNAMRLSHRMVRDFNDTLMNMTDGFDFPHMCELRNVTGVRVSMRRNDGPGRPDGLLVAVAASLWLPFSVDFLFDFFNDDTIRAKWDVLANENPMKPIARISTGTHEGSSVSVMQPYVPNESKLSILQEMTVDSLGASLVYAPIEIRSVTSIINGDEDDHLKAEILPSGIVISSDGRVKKGEAEASSSGADSSNNNNGTPNDGSLVTIAFQILASRAERPKRRGIREAVARVRSLIGSTVQSIREALDIED